VPATQTLDSALELYPREVPGFSCHSPFPLAWQGPAVKKWRSAGRTYTLSGIVLFDYDGNVLRDEGDSISAWPGSPLRAGQRAASPSPGFLLVARGEQSASCWPRP